MAQVTWEELYSLCRDHEAAALLYLKSYGHGHWPDMLQSGVAIRDDE